MTTKFPLRPFLTEMAPYVPGEQVAARGILKLNTNENPYPPPAGVIEEVRKAAASLHLYPNPVSESLRRALAGYHGVEPEHILVGNGSDEILRLLAHACIQPGGCIAVVEPSYSLFPVLATAFEGKTQSYPLDDLEKIPEPLFDAPEPLLFLPNPNPPLGTLFSRAEIARLCRARENRLVVVDEAYVDFAPRDTVPLLAQFPNLVISRTFSKSFSLAGARVGYMLADADLIRQISKIKDSYNVNRLSQAAAAAAIGAAAEMRENCARIVETRRKTADSLREMGYRVPESHGNFVFAIHPEAARHYQCLRERGVLVRYFDQPALRDGIRITIGTPEQMARFFETLKEILTP